MITVQQVYDMAIMLMNEQDDATGATNSSELDGYQSRALALVNILVSDLYYLSDNTDLLSAAKPVPPLLSAFTDGIDLDDRLCVNVLPYGLAGHLFVGENDDASTTFLNLYYTLKKGYGKSKPTAKVAVTNVYGTLCRLARGESDADS